MYTKLVALGFFTTQNQKPIDSAKLASYEEACRLISIHNGLK